MKKHAEQKGEREQNITQQARLENNAGRLLGCLNVAEAGENVRKISSAY